MQQDKLLEVFSVNELEDREEFVVIGCGGPDSGECENTIGVPTSCN